MVNNIKDIDELLEKKGSVALAEVIRKAKPYTQYKVDLMMNKINYKSIEEKRKCIYTLKPYLRELPLIDRNQYMYLLSDKLLYPEIDIRRLLNDNRQVNLEVPVTEEKHIVAQKHILSTIFSGFMTSRCITKINESEIELTSEYRTIFEYIVRRFTSGRTLNQIAEDCLCDLDKGLIADILHKSEEVEWETPEQVTHFIDEQFKFVKLYWQLEKIKSFKSIS